MFESLIEQAHSLIQRLHASAELGLDKVPEATKVRPSELEAWDVAAHGIVALLFGANSAAWLRWRALAERRGGLVGEAAAQRYQARRLFRADRLFPSRDRRAAGVRGRLPASACGTRADGSQSQHHAGAAAGAAGAGPAQPAAQSAAAEPLPLVRTTDDGWELTLALSDEAYDWLRAVVASREPARTGDSAAIVELAATIIERVARNTQRDTRGR